MAETLETGGVRRPAMQARTSIALCVVQILQVVCSSRGMRPRCAVTAVGVGRNVGFRLCEPCTPCGEG